MKEQDEDKNKFKKYWRLILKSRFDLDTNSWKKFRCFSNLMTETDVVDYLIRKNDIFNNSYNLYQDILYYIQHRKHNNFNNIINKDYANISKLMATTLNTLKKYSEYIKNTLEYSYSNGKK